MLIVASVHRNITSIKQVLRSCLGDADAGARKTARMFFLVLHSRIQLQGVMEIFNKELEPQTQKHISGEAQVPCAEYLDLLRLARNPGCVTDAFSAGGGSSVAPTPVSVGAASTDSQSSARAGATLGVERACFGLGAEEEEVDLFAAVTDRPLATTTRRQSLASGPVRLGQRPQPSSTVTLQSSDEAGDTAAAGLSRTSLHS